MASLAQKAFGSYLRVHDTVYKRPTAGSAIE